MNFIYMNIEKLYELLRQFPATVSTEYTKITKDCLFFGFKGWAFYGNS